MESGTPKSLKQRTIIFFELHPDPDQALTAARMLEGISGIAEVKRESPTQLSIRYDLLQVSLEEIETALTDTGFHLSNTLSIKLCRALYYYTEEIERANRGCRRGQCKCTRRIFINRYQKLKHGRHDPRPEHWRRYL